MTSFAISQTVLDSTKVKDSITCIPNSQLRQAIKIIEYGKIVQKELTLTKTGVKILEDRIKIKDSIIYQYKLKDSLWKKDYTLLTIENLNMKGEVGNQQKIADNYKKQLNKHKIDKWLFLAAGFALGKFVVK